MPGKAGFQRAGQTADRGSPAMILDQGRRRLELACTLPTSVNGEENSPFFLENSPEPSGVTDSKFLVSPASFSVSAFARGTAEFRGPVPRPPRDQPVRGRRFLETGCRACAVEVRRNQRVDVVLMEKLRAV